MVVVVFAGVGLTGFLMRPFVVSSMVVVFVGGVLMGLTGCLPRPFVVCSMVVVAVVVVGVVV